MFFPLNKKTLPATGVANLFFKSHNRNELIADFVITFLNSNAGATTPTQMKRALYEGYKNVHNRLHSVKTVSDFQKTGKLTAKEFVEAGDELTKKNPVWQWVGGPDNVQDYLPPNKKCLVYRGAPCFQRAPVDPDVPIQDTTDEDGFVTTEAAPEQPKVEIPEDKVLTWDDDDDEESEDEDAVKPTDSANPQRRVYDVYIVYDKYYETPRIYLVGYKNDHTTPLTIDEMKEDIYHSNYGKTVTIDAHPVLGISCISIHPCRHAETMCHLMNRMKVKHDKEQEGKPDPEPFIFPTHMALFLFLKFISSVVPTIEYDVSSGFDI